MNAQAVRLTRIDIDNALQNAHLEIAFQPIVAFAGRELRRYEAFVRWDHPGLGPLPPGAFLSFFESQGRIGELTRYVLGNTLAAAATADLPDGVGVSINLSVADLTDESLPGAITKMLKTYEWDASRLTLECPLFSPDTTLEAQVEAYGKLAATGCPLALEVRGRASDAMKSFDPFPFAEIKTGGPAVLRQVRSSRGGPGLNTLSELLGFAKERGVEITAVGVEDHEAASALGSLGFNLGQGNALGRAGPLPAGANSGAIMPAEAFNDDKETTEPPLDLSTEEKERSAEGHTRRARIAAAKRVALRRLKAVSTPVADDDNQIPDAMETARTLQSRLEQHFPVTPDAEPLEPETEMVMPEPVPLREPAQSDKKTSVEELIEELPADLRAERVAPAPVDKKVLADTLAAECADPADVLDEAVGELPEIPMDTADRTEKDDQDDFAALRKDDFAESEPPYWLYLLQRKYRITHFWPRSWKRWHRERLAVHEERHEPSEPQSFDDTVRRERREQNSVPVMAERQEHPLVFGPMADLR